jgi:hypothetical protein
MLAAVRAKRTTSTEHRNPAPPPPKREQPQQQQTNETDATSSSLCTEAAAAAAAADESSEELSSDNNDSNDDQSSSSSIDTTSVSLRKRQEQQVLSHQHSLSRPSTLSATAREERQADFLANLLVEKKRGEITKAAELSKMSSDERKKQEEDELWQLDHELNQKKHMARLGNNGGFNALKGGGSAKKKRGPNRKSC